MFSYIISVMLWTLLLVGTAHFLASRMIANGWLPGFVPLPRDQAWLYAITTALLVSCFPVFRFIILFFILYFAIVRKDVD